MSRHVSWTRASHEAGFSLIELLIVLGIMGVVLGAVNSLYTVHQRSATVEGEVVDIQQNLRIGMEQMARDISMAGFLVRGANPVSAVVNNASPTADSVTLNTASESLVAAIVNTTMDSVTVMAGTTLLNLPVFPFNGSNGGFEATDVGAEVQILNDRGSALVDVGPTNTRFTVLEVNDGTNPLDMVCGAVAAPCLQVQAITAGTGNIRPGDMVMKTSVAGGAQMYPASVQYSVAACPAPLAGNCLMRTTVPAPAGGAQVVATNVSDLQIRYLLTGTTEVDAPTATQMQDVRAVRVTVSGQLVDTAAAANGATKTRTLMSIIAIRNARNT
jgi:prepilin-type N-terminal cleavage/methylation domain-containing protein